MKAKRKIKGQAGFTLAETLLAVLILLLVSGIVANGMPTVKRVYDDVVVASNAQVLLSTTVTALRNELGTAYDIKLDGSAIEYHSAVSGLECKIYKNAYDVDSISMEETGIDASGTENTESRRLVSRAASNNNLYVTYESVNYADRVVTFTKVEVKRENGDQVMASLDELKIRTV